MKKFPLDLAVIALCSLLLIGGGVMSYLAFNKIELAITNDEVEKSKFLTQETNKQKVSFFSLPKIQTNVASNTGRLVQAELTVVLEPQEDIRVDEFKPIESAITDLIIDIIAQSTIDELSNVSGKITLSEKIKNGVNELTKKQSVKRVLFSTFSVQLQ